MSPHQGSTKAMVGPQEVRLEEMRLTV